MTARFSSLLLAVVNEVQVSSECWTCRSIVGSVTPTNSEGRCYTPNMCLFAEVNQLKVDWLMKHNGAAREGLILIDFSHTSYPLLNPG
ncbi:hypothetical protein V6N13_109048 [Hibiscus sabdariffa]